MINNKMGRVEDFRHYFHTHPELSGNEVGTQQYINRVLTVHGVVFENVGTGIIAQVGGGNRAIALRADMDALPIIEEGKRGFCSQNSGVMHACGHDMHMAMLLECALRLKKCEDQLQGKVLLLFQPSEERRPGGARLLLPHIMGKVEAIFGQHIAPELPCGVASTRKGAFFASSDNIKFSIVGKGAHAATPHLANNPILAATAAIQGFQSLVDKHCNVCTPAILSITSIHGGTAHNIIPDNVEVLGTVRCHDNVLRESLFNAIDKQATESAALYGCKYIPDMPPVGLPVLINNSALVDKFSKWCNNIVTLQESKPLMLGEDFAIYTEHIPGLFWCLGVATHKELPPLHNPSMIPDDDALAIGVELLTRIALQYFE
ncbi:MAG: M20 metallopeptidase family protein [Marinifilaceae bacterium]